MSFRFFVFALAASLALGATPLHAQRTPARTTTNPPVAQPTDVVSNAERAEIPAERVQATLAAYKRWLKTLGERHAVAGLATAVVVDDKVVFEGTVGDADAAHSEPVTADTVFRLASLSKAFATAVTALEIRDGKFAWDTRLVDVLPFFKLKDVQASNQATVADILGQRLGLPRNTYDSMLEDNVPYEELVRKLDEVDMTCGVGECYSYQNIAFSLIGDVIYNKTGEFFYRLVDKRLFYPLGMRTASYGRAALESSKSWARPHRAASHDRWIPFEPNENYYRVAPAAGVNASLHDMERWLIAQMGGRPDVLPLTLLDVLHHPGVDTPGETRATPWRRARLTSAHYAMGWRVYTYGGETMVYHAGAVEGYRTMIGFFPKYHMGVVTMWNSPGATASGMMPMVFDGMLGLPHVDWAGLESPEPVSKPRRKSRKSPYLHKRRHRHR